MRRNLFTVLVILLAIGLLAGCGGAKKFSRFMNMNELREFAAANPEDLRPIYIMADSFLNMKELDSCRTYVSLLHGKAPDDPIAEMMRAQLFIAEGHPTEAVKILQPLVDHYATHGQLNYNLGRAYLMVGDTYNAAKYLYQAVAVSPNMVEGWMTIANMELSMHNESGSQDAIRALIRLDAADTMMLADMGQIFYQKSLFDSAEIYLKMASEKGSRRAEVYSFLGYIYTKNADWKNAAQAYAKSVEINSGDPLGKVRLAQAYTQLNDPKAGPLFDDLQKTYKYSVTFYYYGEYLEKKGDVEGAKKNYIKARDLADNKAVRDKAIDRLQKLGVQ